MSDSRADALRRVIDRISGMLQDQYLISDREMCDKISRVCTDALEIDSARRKDGYNGSITQAQKALRYLASNPRPNGGEESFNAEHLLQIADELVK